MPTISTTTMTTPMAATIQRNLSMSASFDVHERNAETHENAADRGLLARDDRIQLLFQRIALAHPHRDRELELERREARRAGHRRDLERHRRGFREISAERPPHGRDIDVLLFDRLDQARWRVGLVEILLDHIAANVVDDAFLA